MSASRAEPVDTHPSSSSVLPMPASAPGRRPVVPIAPVPSPAPADEEVRRVAPRGGRKSAVLIVLALAAVGGMGAWYFTHRGLESTDDAQIDAEVIAVPARAAGTALRVLFAENDVVKEGQLLALLDYAPQK